jgi:hypothetical protein
MSSTVGSQPTRRTATAWDQAVLYRGAATGCLGALLVAAFFFLVDVAAGRPFHTPSALGARLFLDVSPQPAGAPSPVLVLAFSLAHIGVFIAIGAIAAFIAAYLDARRTLRNGVIMAAALFAGMDLILLAFAWTFDTGLLHELGWGRVALANGIAAAAMAPILLGTHMDRETRP